jgi:hypothetical protein
MTVDRIAGPGDFVIAEGTSHLRGSESGVVLDARFGHLTEWRDGMCIRFESFDGFADALNAAGIAE